MISISPEEPHTSKKCILCLEALPLTEEHVFADGAGGFLIAFVLCRDCNTSLGKNIDTPYLRHPAVLIARNALNIGGRRNVVPQPFSGPFKVPGPTGEVQITLDDKLRPKVIPRVGEITVLDDGRLQTDFLADATDRDKLPTIIRSKFERFFKSEQGLILNWSSEDQEDVIKRTIEINMASPTEETPVGVLEKKFTGNYEPLILQAAKVAYEIACIEGGLPYITSELGKEFRLLLKSVDRGKISRFETFEEMCQAFHVLPLTEGLPMRAMMHALAKGRLEKCHLAACIGSSVVVSMFGFITIFSDAFPYPSRRVAYVNDCVEKTVLVARD